MTVMNQAVPGAGFVGHVEMQRSRAAEPRRTDARPAFKRTRVLAAACAALIVMAPVVLLFAENHVRAIGLELFDGRRPLVANIDGHLQMLPSTVATCSNCHDRVDATSASVRAPARELIGSELTAFRLTSDLPRRGGPVTHYSAASFCRLLRTGVDPNGLSATRAMPRYEISDTDCGALWATLSDRS